MVSMTVTHPYKRAVTELWLKKAFIIIRLFETFIYGVTLASAWNFLLDFLQVWDMTIES